MHIRWPSVIFLLAILCAGGVKADHLNGQIIKGSAKVISGGTLIIAGKKVGLYGINQISVKAIPWGPRARAVLHRMTAGKEIICRVASHEADHESAKCLIGKLDLADVLVRRGLATADREKSDLYFPAEVAAEKAKAGFWK